MPTAADKKKGGPGKKRQAEIDAARTVPATPIATATTPERARGIGVHNDFLDVDPGQETEPEFNAKLSNRKSKKAARLVARTARSSFSPTSAQPGLTATEKAANLDKAMTWALGLAGIDVNATTTEREQDRKPPTVLFPPVPLGISAKRVHPRGECPRRVARRVLPDSTASSTSHFDFFHSHPPEVARGRVGGEEQAGRDAGCT